MKYDALIVGAGFYGATVANRLADRGAKVLVLDRRDHIAGNSHTAEGLNGIQVHMYGAHIFHTSDEKVWEFANRFTEFNRYTNSPIADYHGEIYNLPFNMNTFSKLWGVKTPDEARAKIASQVAEAGITGEPANLEEQALSMAGRDIYEKLIKGYTEKQWGRPCNELPAFILKRVPFRFIYDNNYFNDPHQGIPKNGYTGMVANMLKDGAAGENVEVRLSSDYFDLVKLDADGLPVRGGEGYILNSGDTADKIIFTGTIDEFFGRRLGALEYRSLRFETDELPEVDNYQGNAVVNYTAAEIPYTRVIEHKHFLFGTEKGTVVTREYPLTWKPGEEPYYAINDEINNKRYSEYLELAKGLKGVFFGGRLGKYRYFNMDQVIGEALRDVDELSENSK